VKHCPSGPEPPPVLAQWTYSAQDFPLSGDQQVRLNLWLRKGLVPTNGQEVEVVFSRFVFVPVVLPEPIVTSAGIGPAGSVHLTGERPPQLIYTLQSSTDLREWILDLSMVAPEGHFLFAKPVFQEGKSQFYRVSLSPQ
jgi:hypothetical protein